MFCIKKSYAQFAHPLLLLFCCHDAKIQPEWFWLGNSQNFGYQYIIAGYG
jgi:hypothetical protein